MRIGEAQVVGQAARRDDRPLGQPGDLRAPALDVARAERRGAAAQRAGVGPPQRQQQRQQRRLPRAAGAHDRHDLPGLEAQVDAVEDRPLAPGGADHHVVEHQRLAGGIADRATRAAAGNEAGPGRRLGDPRERRLRVGRGVVLDADAAQRRIELGGQQQHAQRDLEVHGAAHEPHARDHGDERGAEHRDELKRERTHERRAQGGERRDPVALPRHRQLLLLHVLAPEAAQDR